MVVSSLFFCWLEKVQKSHHRARGKSINEMVYYVNQVTKLRILIGKFWTFLDLPKYLKSQFWSWMIMTYLGNHDFLGQDKTYGNTLVHGVLKITKKSHSTLRAKPATFTLFTKNAKSGQFRRFFEKLNFAVNQCYQTGQKFLKNAKNGLLLTSFLKKMNLAVKQCYQTGQLQSDKN